jgi:CTP:molybdopterin cytidylyltransferase MocA
MAKGQALGIVLAASDGVRMGGSKALLALDGAPGGAADDPLVRAHAAQLLDGGCARVVAVVRPEVLTRLGVLQEARLVVSTADDQAGSLALALHEDRGPPDEIVVITPVGSAPVGGETVRRLVERVEEGALAATPRFETKSGHPIACRRSVLTAFRGAAPYPPLRDVIRALGEGRAHVEVSDPRVAVDLDTPDDVLAFTGRSPRFVGKPT